MTMPRVKELQGSGFAHLFNVSDPEMERNIGRIVKIKETPNGGTCLRYPFKIGGIQRIYDGRLAYRAYIEHPDFVGGAHEWGRPCLPEDIEIWDYQVRQ